jgi:hypothetical protein
MKNIRNWKNVIQEVLKFIFEIYLNKFERVLAKRDASI